MSANNCLESNEVWRAAAPPLPLADASGYGAVIHGPVAHP